MTLCEDPHRRDGVREEVWHQFHCRVAVMIQFSTDAQMQQDDSLAKLGHTKLDLDSSVLYMFQHLIDCGKLQLF